MADSLEAFLNRLHHPALASIDMSLDRMYRLLSLLGSPHKRLPPVVHVAGTNGKGSLIAYLHAIFEAAGYRVHRYTSPHLVHFKERIVIAGKEIENAAVENLVRHVAPVLTSQPATFFEATTAAAFLAFSEYKADVLLMETGMGGRLDATNVIDQPLVTAITPVSIDHSEYLGNTITAIAGEKAGIIKRAVPCVVGRQLPEAAEIIARKANELAAPLYRLGMEWQVKDNVYQSSKRTLTFTPSLMGRHQYDNAATAIACCDQLASFNIDDSHITKGIASAVWPARLQRLTQGKYMAMLPPNAELWLDGGHNPQGGEVLAAWLAEQSGREIYLVCGMVKGKDSKAYLAPLAPYVTALYAINIPAEPHSQAAVQIADAAAAMGIESVAAASVENALQTIARRAKNPATICICGSLYLAGKILAES